jgi:hypothetical protein
MKTKQLQAATVSNLCDIPIRTLGAAAGRAACLIIQATTMAAGNSTGTAVAGSILTDGRGSRPTDHRRQDAAAEAGYSDLEGLAGTTPTSTLHRLLSHPYQVYHGCIGPTVRLIWPKRGEAAVERVARQDGLPAILTNWPGYGVRLGGTGKAIPPPPTPPPAHPSRGCISLTVRPIWPGPSGGSAGVWAERQAI